MARDDVNRFEEQVGPKLFSGDNEFQEVLLGQEGVLFGEGVARVGHLFDDGVTRDEVIF